MLPWLLAAITLAAVALTASSLGRHLFEVFDERPQPAWDRWLNPIEAGLLRWIGDNGRSADSAIGYLMPLLISNALFGALALTLLLVQPPWLNPLGLGGLRWDLALHTTISFATNTKQQHLIPEQTLGTLAQLGAMQFLMFVSAATGLAVGFVVIRRFSGRPIDNFHRDLLGSPLCRPGPGGGAGGIQRRLPIATMGAPHFKRSRLLNLGLVRFRAKQDVS